MLVPFLLLPDPRRLCCLVAYDVLEDMPSNRVITQGQRTSRVRNGTTTVSFPSPVGPASEHTEPARAPKTQRASGLNPLALVCSAVLPRNPISVALCALACLLKMKSPNHVRPGVRQALESAHGLG